MFFSDSKMAQLDYEIRLRETAEWRFAQRIQAQQAPKRDRFWDRLGDLLTLTGTGLKGWDGTYYSTGK